MKYRAVGRRSDIGLVWAFCVINGYKVVRKAQSVFVWEAVFSAKAYNALLKKDWFLKTDVEVFKIKREKKDSQK